VAASTGSVSLSDGRAGALASGETTAALLALRVAGARGEDDLLAVLVSGRRSRCSRSGRSSWGSRSSATSSGGERNAVKFGDKGSGLLDGRVGEVAVNGSCNTVAEFESSSDVAVGLRATVAAATVAGLGDSGASALAGVEGAAALLAVGVDGAWPGHELVATTSEGVAGRKLMTSLDTDGNEGEGNEGSGELHGRRFKREKSQRIEDCVRE
jgi:hypothetical protein